MYEISRDKGAHTPKLVASMTGAQEVPTPGDPDGSGSAVFWLNQDAGRICYSLSVANIEPATAAHIHQGAVGVPGPVVVALVPPTDGFSSDCVSVSSTLIANIVSNPAGYYVNVHNTPFPGGAVRGQLSEEDSLSGVQEQPLVDDLRSRIEMLRTGKRLF